MTTEDDFQRRLEEQPDDFQTRLVFADWLQDRGDERAEGFRALGVLQRCPLIGTGRREGQAVYLCEFPHGRDFGAAYLPEDWHALVGTWHWCPFRRAAEDAAARAFAQLPPGRRAELQAPPGAKT